MGGTVESGVLMVRALFAVMLAALVAPPARAADAGTPGSHSSPGAKAPATSAGPYSLQCGKGYCDARTQYCETIKTDVPELPSDHGCMPLPPACRVTKRKGIAQDKALSCGCFPSGTRCDFCQTIEQGNGLQAFYRTCIGGY